MFYEDRTRDKTVYVRWLVGSFKPTGVDGYEI